MEPSNGVLDGDKPRLNMADVFKMIAHDESSASWLFSKERFAPYLTQHMIQEAITFDLRVLPMGPASTSDSEEVVEHRQRQIMEIPAAKVAAICHAATENRVFFTLVDTSLPSFPLDAPSMPRKAARRGVMIYRGGLYYDILNTWLEDGRSLLWVNTFRLSETETYSERWTILLDSYPDSRFPTISDALEYSLSCFENRPCTFCSWRGSQCECSRSVRQRANISIPTVDQRDLYTMWRWIFYGFEVGLKGYSVHIGKLREHFEMDIRALSLITPNSRTASDGHSGQGFDCYMRIISSYFDDKMVTWNQIIRFGSPPASATKRQLDSGSNSRSAEGQIPTGQSRTSRDSSMQNKSSEASPPDIDGSPQRTEESSLPDRETVLKTLGDLAVYAKVSRSESACKFCGTVFGRKHDLKRHLSAVHLGLRSFVCEICNKSFTRKHYLESHMSRDHGDGAEFTCEFCGKLFSTVNSKKRHLNTIHHKEET